MPAFRLPLSGNVTQSINPWTMLFNPVGSQVGLVNIDLGQSSQPEVEQEVLTDVASYGKSGSSRRSTVCATSSQRSRRSSIVIRLGRHDHVGPSP